MFQNFTLEDPDLHTAHAVSRVSACNTVVDVCTQRVKRDAAFAVPFDTRNFRTAETATAVDTDALCTETHGGLNGPLHGATESNAAFQLLGNRLGDQGRVDFRLAHFNDVEMHFGIGDVGDLLAKTLDIGTLLPMTTPGRPE